MNAVAAGPTDTRPLPRAWLIVGLLWGVGCLNYLDRLMLVTMRDSIKAAIPMSDADFGILTTAFLVIYGVMSPVGGWCADRFSRSRVILVSLGVWSVVTLATAYAQTYGQLLATRALMGVSEACYIPAALALIADYHRGTTRSLATGIHMSGLYVGAALGGLGGWMAERYGWSSGFLVFGGAGVAFAVVLAFFLRDAAPEPGAKFAHGAVHPWEVACALGGNRTFWLIALHWGVLGFAGWAMVAWMPTFLRERHDLSQTSAGLTATVVTQAAAFLGVLGGGAWADRWSRTNLRGRLSVPLIALALAAPFIFGIAHTHALWLAVLGLLVFGFARGCADANMMPILCQVAEPQHRATGYGVLNLLSCCIGGVAAYLGGWLKDQKADLGWLLMGSATGVLMAALLLLPVRPTRSG